MFDSLFDDCRRDRLHSAVEPTISFPASAQRLIELTRDGRSRTGSHRVGGREQGGLSRSSEELFSDRKSLRPASRKSQNASRLVMLLAGVIAREKEETS